MRMASSRDGSDGAVLALARETRFPLVKVDAASDGKDAYGLRRCG